MRLVRAAGLMYAFLLRFWKPGKNTKSPSHDQNCQECNKDAVIFEDDGTRKLIYTRGWCYGHAIEYVKKEFIKEMKAIESKQKAAK